MSKVIWYLHHYAGSPNLGMSYRPYYLAREFIKAGYSTFVIAANFHHLKLSINPQNTPISHQIIDNINYIWVKTNRYKYNNIKRYINMLSYSFKLYWYHKTIVKITSIPNIIIVSSSHIFHFPSALWLAKKFNSQLIFEVRDLWPLSLIELMGMSNHHPVIRIMSWIEKLAYKRSDKTVSLLPHAFSYMEKKGLSKENFCYIPNGMDEKVAECAFHHPLPMLLQRTIQSKKQLNQFLIGYAGAHGIPNALEQIISALAILQKNDINLIHVFFVGEGNQKATLQEKVEKLQLRNISFFSKINKFEIYNFLSNMDGLILTWQNKGIYQYGISPNKLYDYMLAKKPIIHAISTLNNPVAEADCGISVNAEQPDALAKAMQQLATTPFLQLERMGLNGYNYVLKHHRYVTLANQYLRIFKC